jgi:hypothetical protein
LGLGNHLVYLLDALNSVSWLLEQALSDVSHDSLVLSDLGWDANKYAELGREEDALSFLFDFKQRL